MGYMYTLPELFEEQQREMKDNINFGCPAKIINVSDLEQFQRVDVQPLLNKLDMDGTITVPPKIENVFVQFPSGGGAVLSFPLAVNDIVWLKFSNKSMDEWLNTDGKQNATPLDRRVFNYNDCVVDPCIGTFSNNYHPSPKHVELKFKGAVIRITDTGDVEINAKNIKCIAEDDLILSGKNVNIESTSLKHNGVNIGDDHVHSGVLTGAGDTQGPK